MVTIGRGSRLVWPLVPLLALAGCSATPDEPQPEVLGEGKVGVPEAMTSLEWLLDECPKLADATAVTYYGGYLGDQVDDRLAIGPHDLWRDLVVTLPEGSAAALVHRYGMEAATTEPDVVSLLKPELPLGQFFTSEEFDSGICAPYLWVEGWVSVEDDQVVLTVFDS